MKSAAGSAGPGAGASGPLPALAGCGCAPGTPETLSGLPFRQPQNAGCDRRGCRLQPPHTPAAPRVHRRSCAAATAQAPAGVSSCRRLRDGPQASSRPTEADVVRRGEPEFSQARGCARVFSRTCADAASGQMLYSGSVRSPNQRLRGIGSPASSPRALVHCVRGSISIPGSRSLRQPLVRRFHRSLLEPGAIVGRALGDVLPELRFLVFEQVSLALRSSCTGRPGLQIAEEGVDAREQARCVPAHHPLHRALLGRGNPRARQGRGARRRELARIDDRVLRLAGIVLDRIGGARCGLLHFLGARCRAGVGIAPALGANREASRIRAAAFPVAARRCAGTPRARYARIDLRRIGDANPLWVVGERSCGNRRPRLDSTARARSPAGTVSFTPSSAAKAPASSYSRPSMLGEVITGRQVQRRRAARRDADRIQPAARARRSR